MRLFVGQALRFSADPAGRIGGRPRLGRVRRSPGFARLAHRQKQNHQLMIADRYQDI
jgi:hypothetical protein